MVTFKMKVVLKLSVWALRACSYKTKAKDWAAGHRPPSSSRGLSWFLSCFQQWFDGFKGFKMFKRFEGSFQRLSFSFLTFSLPHNITSSFHENARARVIYI